MTPAPGPGTSRRLQPANFSDPFPDQITGGIALSVKTAIYDDSGKLSGVGGGDMDIGPITEYVIGLRVFDKVNGALLL